MRLAAILLTVFALAACAKGPAPTPIAQAAPSEVPWIGEQYREDAQYAQLRRSEAILRTRRELADHRLELGVRDWFDLYASMGPFLARVRTLIKEDPYNPDKLNYYQFVRARDGFYYHGEALGVLEQHKEEYEQPNEVVETLCRYHEELRAHGIDLIFLPVPTSIEVYPEYVGEQIPIPPVVDPGMRAMVDELLLRGVEVIDLTPRYKELAAKGGEPLYVPGDSHWSYRGLSEAADLLAERLERYDFVRQSMAESKPWSKQPQVDKNMIKAESRLPEPLREETARRVEMASERVLKPDGQPFEAPETAPILVLGDSQAYYYSINWGDYAGLTEQLAYRLRQPVGFKARAGFIPNELGRDAPHVLTDAVRVIILVIDARQLRSGIDWRYVPWFGE